MKKLRKNGVERVKRAEGQRNPFPELGANGGIDAPPSVRDLLPRIAAMQREPFQEILSLFVGAAPTYNDIKKFASLYPDRYANAVAVFARLSGYAEKMDITQTTNINVRIAHMSDAELEAEVQRIRDANSELPMLELHPTEPTEPIELAEPEPATVSVPRSSKRSRP